MSEPSSADSDASCKPAQPKGPSGDSSAPEPFGGNRLLWDYVTGASPGELRKFYRPFIIGAVAWSIVGILAICEESLPKWHFAIAYPVFFVGLYGVLAGPIRWTLVLHTWGLVVKAGLTVAVFLGILKVAGGFPGELPPLTWISIVLVPLTLIGGLFYRRLVRHICQAGCQEFDRLAALPSRNADEELQLALLSGICLDRVQEASQHMERAALIGKGSSRVWLAAARFLEDMKQFQQASSALRQVAEDELTDDDRQTRQSLRARLERKAPGQSS